MFILFETNNSRHMMLTSEYRIIMSRNIAQIALCIIKFENETHALRRMMK